MNHPNPVERGEIDSVDSLLDAIEGSVSPQASDGSQITCDRCGEAVDTDTPLETYASDQLVNDDQSSENGSMNLLRAYCNFCSIGRISRPCRGYLELLFSVSVDDDMRLRSPCVVDISPPTDGEDWRPVEAWNEMDGPSWGKFTALTDIRLGPEDVADFIAQHDGMVDES